MNKNQFGFTPQKGTIDEAMVIKAVVKEGLAAGEVIALVCLEVQGAFDATWWSGILKELRACGCPKYLYELTKCYFNQRTATLSTNSLRLENEISRGPGFWNLQYNSLLNLKFMARRKVVAFADYLIMVTRCEWVRAVENYVNAELSKITLWSKKSKTKFNEKKFKIMLVSRRKRRETGILEFTEIINR